MLLDCKKSEKFENRIYVLLELFFFEIYINFVEHKFLLKDRLIFLHKPTGHGIRPQNCMETVMEILWLM